MTATPTPDAAEQTARAILADIAAGRVVARAWDEGREQRIAQAADRAEVDRLFAEAGMAT
jgi:murein endopeptidase